MLVMVSPYCMNTRSTSHWFLCSLDLVYKYLMHFLYILEVMAVFGWWLEIGDDCKKVYIYIYIYKMFWCFHWRTGKCYTYWHSQDKTIINLFSYKILWLFCEYVPSVTILTIEFWTSTNNVVSLSLICGEVAEERFIVSSCFQMWHSCVW
jgi:hypothetical protein